MYKIQVEIENKSGLHARPASMFIKEAIKYKSDIKLLKKDKEYNGKSMMGILSIGASKGDVIEISADGPDEKEAIHSLAELIRAKFHEA